MTRKLRILPTLVVVPLLALAASSTVVPTDAAWNDDEWVVAEGTRTVDCQAPDGLVAGTARGRVLSGSLLGLDLDTVAALDGVRATSDGTTATQSPAAASPVANLDDAWADPLDLSLVAGILGLSSAGITLPLDTPVGVVGQFAQAHGAGDFVGASGAVNNSGLLELTPGPGGYPDLASLELKQLVASINPGVANLLDQVAALRLDVGAVASRASVLDACGVLFAGGTPNREYLSAGLDLELESPLVSALVTDVEGLLTVVEGTVNGLAGNQGVLDEITGGVLGLVGGLLNFLGLARVEVTLTAEIDLDPVLDALVEPVSDSGGVLTVRPGDGRITIDLAALLAETYPGEYSDGLNGLDPNSSLLGDPRILTTLLAALDEALTDWLDGIDDLLEAALDSISVSLTGLIYVPAVLVNLLEVEIAVAGPLGALTHGEIDATANLRVGSLPAATLSALVSALVNGLGAVVGSAVTGVVGGLGDATSATLTTVAQITSLVSLVYNQLFLSGVVELTMNAQNDPASGDPEPVEWGGIPEGQHDVAALRVGVLDAFEQLGVYVHLARSSVGPLCWAAESPC